MQKTEAIQEINNILEQKPAAVTPWEGFDVTQDLPEGVFVILAHWDYENECVKKYAGINWIFRQWRNLRRKEIYNRNFIAKIRSWKICILGFETEQYIRTMEKTNRWLLSLETVRYLQTPPGKLEDIKETIDELSKAHVNSDSTGEFEPLCDFVDEMNIYEKLNDYFHIFCRDDYSSLNDFREYIQQDIPGTLEEYNDLMEFRKIEDTESYDFKEKRDELSTSIQQKLKGDFNVL